MVLYSQSRASGKPTSGKVTLRGHFFTGHFLQFIARVALGGNAWFRVEHGGIQDGEGMVQLLHKLGRKWGKVNDRLLIWSTLRGKKFWLGRKKLAIQISQDLCFTGDYTGCNINLLSETLTMSHSPLLVIPCTFFEFFRLNFFGGPKI